MCGPWKEGGPKCTEGNSWKVILHSQHVSPPSLSLGNSSVNYQWQQHKVQLLTWTQGPPQSIYPLLPFQPQLFSLRIAQAKCGESGLFSSNLDYLNWRGAYRAVQAFANAIPSACPTSLVVGNCSKHGKCGSAPSRKSQWGARLAGRTHVHG